MTRLQIIRKPGIQILILSFLAVFVYGMGIFSILEPATREESLRVTPYALLLSLFVLLLFAQTTYSYRMGLVFLAIAVMGYGVEILGIQSGIPFGNYAYGRNFGIRWWDTPPLIGINWLFLTYAWAAVTEYFPYHTTGKILWGALLMLLYDLLLEKAAPLMGFWDWEGTRVPVQNYISWFLLAVFFQWFLRHFRLSLKNPIALPLLALQGIMFLFIILFLS